MTDRRRTITADPGGWLLRYPYVLPLLILAVGAFFRFFNLNWDSGYQLHPDERWIYEVVSGANGNPPLSWPTSWAQFTAVSDPTGGSPLNPHFFAYGSLPFYLLAFVAGIASFLGRHVPFLSSWSNAWMYSNLPLLGRALAGVLDLGSVTLVFLLGRRTFGYWAGVVAMALTAFTVLNIQLAHFFTVDILLLPLCLLTLLAATEIVRRPSRRAYVLAGIALGAALATKTTALLLVVPLAGAAVLPPILEAEWRQSGSLILTLRQAYVSAAVRLNPALARLLVTYLVAAAVFVIFEPYAVLDRARLLSDIETQNMILVTNNPPFGAPYTIQYAHDLPYVYQIANILFWSMGIPLAVTAFAGTLWALARLVRLRLPAEQIVLLLWVVPYFLFVGTFFAKFNRYMLPILPVMALFGAALLVALVQRARGWMRLVPSTALAVAVGGALLYSVAYMNIYAHLNTRVAATQWIYAHVPQGSTIAVESPWDDPLPEPDATHNPTQFYRQTNLDLYHDELSPDGDQYVINNISDVLQHDQYIVMSSMRMIDSIPKLPLRLPLATRYYQLLFGGKLNFRLVKVFQQHPQLGPFVVHDYPADESFHVYDHPLVRIWERTGPISAARVRHLLTTGLPNVPPGADLSTVAAILRPTTPPPDPRLMLTNKQWQADQQGGTLASMFPASGFGMQHPILAWLLAIEIIGLLTFPLLFPIFGRLLDRGFVVAKTFGLVILGYLVWIAVTAGVTTYTRGAILAALALLALGGVAAGVRQRMAIASWLRSSWRWALAGELVFLAGFAAFILLRMWYPDLGHQFSPVTPTNLGAGRMGEKQMELAFINAIVRSRVFPPYDPFFAHGYINYYYYGFYLVGTLCKLTQIVPATGFNLAIATFFGLLVGGICSAALNLTRRIAPSVAAAVLVGAIGNLNGAVQLVDDLIGVGTMHLNWPLLGGVIDALSGLRAILFDHALLPPFDFWGPTRIVPPTGSVISEFPYFSYLFADLHPHIIAFPMTAAALVLAVALLRSGFPNWWIVGGAALAGALLLGAIAVTNPWDYPTYLLVAGLAAAIGAYQAARSRTWRTWVPPAGWLIALAAISALLYLPFKQSYQTVFVSGIGLVRGITPAMLSSICPPGQTSCPGLVHDALVTPLPIYLEQFGLFLFIILTFCLLVAGRDLGAGRTLHRFSTWVRFVWYYRDRLPRVGRAIRAVRVLAPRSGRHPDLGLFWIVLALLAALAGLGYYLLAFLIGALALVAALISVLGRRLSASELFVLAAVALGLTLSAVTQVVFVKDWLAEGPSFRMNTIFKFYNQVWVLFALAAACTLYFLIERLLAGRSGVVEGETGAERYSPVPLPARATVMPSLPAEALAHIGSPFTPLSVSPSGVAAAAIAARPVLAAGPARRTLARILLLAGRYPLWSGCLAALLAASFIYTYAGTVARETYRQTWLPENSVPFTLDGMAFMKVAYPGEYAAIQWINSHVAGAPVIAEAGPSYYDWRSRVSMFTGLPTIINGIHEPEQRYGDELDPSALCGETRDPNACLQTTHSRAADVETLYNSPSIADAWTIIHRYGVRYIYVGFVERMCSTDPNTPQCYSRAGLAKFNRMVGHGLRVAYNREGVTIYRVTA